MNLSKAGGVRHGMTLASYEDRRRKEITYEQTYSTGFQVYDADALHY